jgi:hypothetical protein
LRSPYRVDVHKRGNGRGTVDRQHPRFGAKDGKASSDLRVVVEVDLVPHGSEKDSRDVSREHG